MTRVFTGESRTAKIAGRVIGLAVLAPALGYGVYSIATARDNAPTLESIRESEQERRAERIAAASSEAERRLAEEEAERQDALRRSPFNVDRSPEMQAKRLELIAKLTEVGVIYKVELPGRYPHIYVGPSWRDTGIDEKTSFVSAILAYYHVRNPKSTIAVLKDYRTGEDVGRFDQYGLHLE